MFFDFFELNFGVEAVMKTCHDSRILNVKIKNKVMTVLADLKKHVCSKIVLKKWIWRDTSDVRMMWGTLVSQLKELDKHIVDLNGKVGCCANKE